MAENVFGYAADDLTSLQYRRQLGAGGFGTVHEVPYHSFSKADVNRSTMSIRRRSKDEV